MKTEIPTQEEYMERKMQIALDFCPRIYSCCKCKNPVAAGYCCTFCGDTNPSSKHNADDDN